MIKVCPTCGKEFKTRYTRVKYCSHECYIATRRKETVIKVCPTCGKKFTDKRHPDKKYCCKKCSRIAQVKDLTGKKFGKLTVLEYSFKPYYGKSALYFLCQCECGNQRLVRGSAPLTNGYVLTCGECNKHHKTGTRLHNVWRHMKRRCLSKNDKLYKYYGARGITICQEWLDNFMNFYNWAMANGYSDELTIDRIDVNGNYEPSNCRWVTMKVQANNTRRNRYVTYKGETHTLSEWCDILGLDKGLIRNRVYRYKWSIEKAFTTPKLFSKKEKSK